jgi:FKBP-type peptidyl-prolyl cis-trans isomerase (trigger factor)
MSEKAAKEFFEKMEESPDMQAKIKLGLEKLAKDLGYDATEDELTAELQKRWECQGHHGPGYSEPPGY